MAQMSFRFATPGSSNIESVNFDAETDTLSVTFHDGRTWDYLNVSISVARAFQSASSAGQFLNRHIKGRYSAQEQ